MSIGCLEMLQDRAILVSLPAKGDIAQEVVATSLHASSQD